MAKENKSTSPATGENPPQEITLESVQRELERVMAAITANDKKHEQIVAAIAARDKIIEGRIKALETKKAGSPTAVNVAVEATEKKPFDPAKAIFKHEGKQYRIRIPRMWIPGFGEMAAADVLADTAAQEKLVSIKAGAIEELAG